MRCQVVLRMGGCCILRASTRFGRLACAFAFPPERALHGILLCLRGCDCVYTTATFVEPYSFGRHWTQSLSDGARHVTRLLTSLPSPTNLRFTWVLLPPNFSCNPNSHRRVFHSVCLSTRARTPPCFHFSFTAPPAPSPSRTGPRQAHGPQHGPPPTPSTPLVHHHACAVRASLCRRLGDRLHWPVCGDLLFHRAQRAQHPARFPHPRHHPARAEQGPPATRVLLLDAAPAG